MLFWPCLRRDQFRSRDRRKTLGNKQAAALPGFQSSATTKSMIRIVLACVFPSLYLSLTGAHTLTFSSSRTHTNSLFKHSFFLSLSLTHTHSHTHTLLISCRPNLSLTHTLCLSHTHTLSFSHTHSAFLTHSLCLSHTHKLFWRHSRHRFSLGVVNIFA